MILERLSDFAFPAGFMGNVKAFVSQLTKWHAELGGEQILIESGSVNIHGKECMAVCGTSSKNNSSGEPQILGFCAIIVEEK